MSCEAHGMERPTGSGCRSSLVLVLAVVLWWLEGCSDSVRGPTQEQLETFEKAEVVAPTVDAQRLDETRLQLGPYRVVGGDVLEFTVPAALHAVTAAEVMMVQTRTQGDHPYLCRVNERGGADLPAVGEVAVAGLTLSQIEAKVADVYGNYVAVRPAVVVRVVEYKTYDIYITGAVEKPGVYALRGDHMTLAHLLSEAGGILMRDASEALMRDAGGISGPGAALVRITPCDQGTTRALRRKTGDSISLGVERESPLTVLDRGDDGINISFTVRSLPGTVGQLVLSRGGQPLLEEWLDLGNEWRRHMTLSRLAALDSQCHTIELDAKLIAMAGHVASHPLQTKTLVWTDLQGPSGSRTMGSVEAPAVVLPVYGLNIPLANVALHEGDTVVVERLKVPMFSVIGLVRNPGNFPYPPDTQYNLMQAIAFAGGLDPVADPRYATVYRLIGNGSVVRVPFRLVKEDELTEALATPIKPGDVVAIEHTPRTRRNTMINTLVRFNTGIYLTGSDVWGQ